MPRSRDIFNLGRVRERGLSSCGAHDTWQSGNFRSSRREVGTFSDLGCSYSSKAPLSGLLNGANIIKKSKQLSMSSCGTAQEFQYVLAEAGRETRAWSCRVLTSQMLGRCQQTPAKYGPWLWMWPCLYPEVSKAKTTWVTNWKHFSLIFLANIYWVFTMC